MECRFAVNGSLNLGLLTVLWEQKKAGPVKIKRGVHTLQWESIPSIPTS